MKAPLALTILVLLALGGIAAGDDDPAAELAGLRGRVTALQQDLAEEQRRHTADVLALGRQLEEANRKVEAHRLEAATTLSRVAKLEQEKAVLEREIEAVPTDHWVARLDAPDVEARWIPTWALARRSHADPRALRALLTAGSRDEATAESVLDALARSGRDLRPSLQRILESQERTDQPLLPFARRALVHLAPR